MTPSLYLMIGLPGVGKTTLARRLAAEHRCLRLTPDEWLIPMHGFGNAGEVRDVLEGRMLWAAHEVLRSGSSVVVDFGCWGEDERWAIHAIARFAGAAYAPHFVSVPEQVRRQRARERHEADPDAEYPMSDDLHDAAAAVFQPQSDAERRGEFPPAPSGFESWLHYASDRWPSLPRLDQVTQ